MSVLLSAGGQNAGDQRLATLDKPYRSISSRVRCIALFGPQGYQSLPLESSLPDLISKTANECFPYVAVTAWSCRDKWRTTGAPTPGSPAVLITSTS